jgi:hypothetical protein
VKKSQFKCGSKDGLETFPSSDRRGRSAIAGGRLIFDRIELAILCSLIVALGSYAVWQNGGQSGAQVRKGVGMIDKESLAKRVESSSPEAARLIRAENTIIDRYETPFFDKGTIYRVTHLGKYRPITFVFGLAGDDYTVSLPLNPDGFVEFAQRAGLHLDSNELRLAYVAVFLETTRDFQKRFQILRSFNDIELIRSPRPEELTRYKQLEEKYASVIRPPKISDSAPWEINLLVLRGQNLLKSDVVLEPDGKVKVSESILEKDLPISYVK